MTEWDGFKGMKWRKQINVAAFIEDNYSPYEGNEGFLQSPTDRTLRILNKIEKLLEEEQKNGGVLKIDADNIMSMHTYGPGYIDKKNEIIVGLQTDAPLKRAPSPFSGIRSAKTALEERGLKMGQKILDYFQFRTTHNDGVFRVYNEEMLSARRCGVITGLPDGYGRGRIIGDYRRLPLYGMDFLIAEKIKDKEMLGKKSYSENNIKDIEDVQRQLDSMKIMIDLGKEYGLELNRPARNAKEAVQWLYFSYLGAAKEQNGAATSMGRISTFLDIYFERDLKNGTLNEKQAQEIIDDFVLKLRLIRHLRTKEYDELFAGDPTWVTLAEGGVSALTNRHMVTKTSYRVLNTLYNLKSSSEPNITILWSSQLPENYKKYCAKVSIDTDSIQYENDDIMRPVFGSDYGIACCVSAMKIGKQMQYFGARCNIAKVLLFALNGGKDEISGGQVGPEGKMFDEGLLSYDEVFAAYNKYKKWIAKLYVNVMNIIHFMHDKYAYERYMMSMHDVNVERLMAFGMCGLSVLADSLSAIKHAKVYAIKDERGIISDFKIEGDFPKYGNDDDRVDKIASFIVEDFYKELCKTKAYRNAKHTLSVLTITSNVVYGKKTGSTPDGRKLGEPFAPGANPMHKRESCGALCSLNSVAKLDYNYCLDGISNTFTVTPDTLGKNDENRINNLVNVLDGYFSKKAHHLNVNVLSRDMLVDAMNNPDKYPNLTIRVSGYAVNFNKLSRCQQEEVIARSFHEAF